MDCTSKKIITFMKQSPDTALYYYNDPYEDIGISEDEFYRCVRYLSSKNLIEYVSNQNGDHLGIVLSHVCVHSKEIKRDSFFHWFTHSFAGGVITGAAATLASEGVLYLCAKLAESLLSLL